MSAINKVDVLDGETSNGKNQGKRIFFQCFFFIVEFQRQRSIRSSTNDKSQLISGYDETYGDDNNQTHIEKSPSRNDKHYESIRSTNSTSSQQPLKLSGLSYAFSSSTLPSVSVNGEGIKDPYTSFASCNFEIDLTLTLYR